MVAIDAFVGVDLAAGRLVVPFSLRVPAQGAYYSAYRSDEPQAMRVRAFEAWILQQAGAIEVRAG